MLFAFASAEWYASDSAMPRYCEDREGVVERVGLILTKNEPVGSGNKRPFIVAAKLIFLVPMNSGEPVGDYIERLTRHIDKVCNRF